MRPRVSVRGSVRSSSRRCCETFGRATPMTIRLKLNTAILTMLFSPFNSSPDGDGDRPCKRSEHKAEVSPRPVSLGRLGEHEKMDHDPQTHRESQRKPNQIAGGLVYSPNGFALRAANTYSDNSKRPDEHHAQKAGHYSHPHRDCRHPCRGLWLGAHNLNLPANCFRTVIEGAQSRRTLGEETAFATSQITANPSFNLSFTVRSGTTRATAHTLAESFRLGLALTHPHAQADGPPGRATHLTLL